MARAIMGAVMLFTMAAQNAFADDGVPMPDEVAAAADEAQVNPVALLGAVFTTGLEPKEYLYQTGELERPAPPLPSFGPWRDARAWCVEGIESHHGVAMYNPISVHGEHAQGYLGWLPSTARSVGVTIGNRESEWAGFRRMLAAGRGTEYYGIWAGIC